MQLACMPLPFIWTDQCQKACETLRDTLMKSSIFVYSYPSKPYTLSTDTSRYAWSSVLTQELVTVIDGKTLVHQHPITYIILLVNLKVAH